MTDQQRADTFSCVNPEIHTPSLDALIDDSVFFENAYCVSPSCVPSRAAIMTGKYPSECGCPDFITKLPETETTFMKRLQDAGYYTAVIGKQHFNGSEIDKGYDEEHIIDGHFALDTPESLGSYLDFLEKNKVEPESTSTEAYISGAHWNVAERFHIDEYIGELGKEWLADRAERMGEASRQPWFLTLSFPGPHHPYDGEGTGFEKMYDENQLTVPPSYHDDLSTKPKQYREMDGYAHIYCKDFSQQDYLRSKRSYYANISLIDHKVGEVLNLMKQGGTYEDTLIIYTSDHGDFMGDYGLMEKLQCLQDSLMRVPLFVKPPVSGFAGKKIQDRVLNLDIASTCLDAAGIPIDPLLSNYPYTGYWDVTKPNKKREYLYFEAGRIRGCLQGDYKTAFYVGRPYGELYNVKTDPHERWNLWDDPDCQQEKWAAAQTVMEQMYHSIPQWTTPWNHGTPEV